MLKTGIYLRGDETNLFHLSIGQVVHKNRSIALIQKKDGLVTLPRETTYLEENYLECLQRGAAEELGIVVQPLKFLGSLNSTFKRTPHVVINKTTLYFLTEFVNEMTQAQEADELSDLVLWKPIESALDLLKKSGEQEEIIVERSMKYLSMFKTS